MGPESKSPLKPKLHQKPLYIFALMCRRLMVRPSEGYYAKWEDLNFNTGTDKAELKILDDEHFEHNVKKQSYRTLSVPARLTAILKELHKTAKTEYIIDARNTKTNARLTAEYFFKVVAKELDNLGLEKATAYSFRHTGATHMVVINKQDLPTTRKITGHKTLETISKYVHPLSEDMIEAAQMLEDLEYGNEPITCGEDCLRCPKNTEIIKAAMFAMKFDNKKDRLN
ncbi:tyrosine-type recombinase/integrase [Elusimicrobium posterum]|uniref:tyrosine-type recombinase/integrase n=1 Tax=Elusimicrobium posterum TaxID=3116653 RepID=UPI003C750C85